MSKNRTGTMDAGDAAAIEKAYSAVHESTREVTCHHVAGEQSHCVVRAVGERRASGANQKYTVGGSELEFQPNGDVTMEGLLAVVIDRLEGFQNGPASCGDNNVALVHARNALASLQRRTRFMVGLRPRV